MKRNGSLLLAVVLVIAMVLAGCNNANSPDKPVKDTLVVVDTMQILSLDPTINTPDCLVSTQLFDTLTKVAPDYSVAPRLAESWEDSADGLSTIFKIRKGVSFSDGSSVSAEDVVFSINRFLESPYGSSLLYLISGAELVDEYTVKVNKGNREVDPAKVCAEYFFVVPKKVVEADADKFNEQPVGSGPYVFVKKDTDGSIVMKANEDYYLGAPEIKTVTVKPPMAASTAVVALQTGEVDVVFDIPTSLYDTIEKDENLTLKKEAPYTQVALVLTGNLLAENVKFRQAIYHAVNNEEVLAIAYDNNGSVANSLIPEKVIGNTLVSADASELNKAMDVSDRYNPELAKQLLDESGFDVSQPFTVYVTPDTANVAQVIQANLKTIGLEMDIQQVDTSVWYPKILSGDNPLAIASFGGYYITVSNFNYPVVTLGDPGNIWKCSKSPEFDEAVVRSLEDPNPDNREKNIKDQLEAMKALQFTIPLCSVNNNVAYTNRLADVPNIALTQSGMVFINFGDIKLAKGN